ncbi:MAG: hypothetical protein HGJ94_17770 [Desulfosarcina sp.]|nr:hypothetical protein [Desulfosarcina sp.]
MTARVVFHILFKRMRKTEFHLFLFCLFFLLFNWPLLTLIEKTRPTAGFLYFYLTWSALVVLLAVIARHCRPSSTDSADQEKPRK